MRKVRRKDETNAQPQKFFFTTRHLGRSYGYRTDLHAVDNNPETNSVKNRDKADMPGFKSAYATLNNIRIHYWIGGNPEGQPILLWHDMAH
jgi:hypothetical protein